MRFTVLTHKGPYNFASDYIDHMYPVDSMYKACKQIESEPEFSDVSSAPVKATSLAGPLKNLPNDLNGQKRKQSLLSELDRTLNVRNARAADRLNWKGQNSIPSSAVRAQTLAPILPSSSLHRRTTTNAGLAMAVGVIMQKGRAIFFYDIVKRKAKQTAAKAKEAYPDKAGCILSVCIKYLKVERDYGRAPELFSVTVDGSLDELASIEFNSINYVNNKIIHICKPQLSPEPEISIKNNPAETADHNKYGYAILYLKCEW